MFDGPDGSGKSTQFARFSAYCREQGLVVCEVRDPGGTSIGDQIRATLLDPTNTEMSLPCEMLLYMASRAQLVDERVRPAMARGELVLGDRFVSSTLAYQGTGGGLSPEQIIAVANVAVADTWPDRTVIFDVDQETAAARLPAKESQDRMERKGDSYHQRVRRGFLDLAQAQPEKYLVVDARAEADVVFASLLAGLEEHLRKG